MAPGVIEILQQGAHGFSGRVTDRQGLEISEDQ